MNCDKGIVVISVLETKNWDSGKLATSLKSCSLWKSQEFNAGLPSSVVLFVMNAAEIPPILKVFTFSYYDQQTHFLAWTCTLFASSSCILLNIFVHLPLNNFVSCFIISDWIFSRHKDLSTVCSVQPLA